MQNMPDYYHANELTHKYSGNGWYFLKADQPGYALVATLDTKTRKPASRVWMAATDMLSKWEFDTVDPDTKVKTHHEPKLEGDTLAALEEVRADLAEGRKQIKNGYIVKA